MKVNRLGFRDYRNLKENELIPGPQVNVICGDNAQGKTNLLEAVWLFTGGRSFRGARDQELIAFSSQVGAVLALVLTSIGVPALAFSLGMFIPMELNAPLVVGGLVAWFVSNRSKDEALNKARFDRGTLIASGFIAGGALMGVVSALLKFAEVDWFLSGWASSNAAEWTGLVMYLALIGYFGWHTLKAKEEE